MIRHQYTNCASCHVDPSGAGLMTQYGRAQSEILLRTQYGKLAEDEEDPVGLGGFLFGAFTPPEGLLLQGDVRSAVVRVKPPESPAVDRFILMQADFTAGVVIDRARAAVSLGYVHEGALAASVTHGEYDRLVSRQHWAGFTFGEDEAFLLRGGRMNLPFGLRVVEHTLWIKAATRTDVNAAQQHGIALAYGADAWRAELMGIAGNLQLAPPDLREHGYAGYVERAFGQRAAVGLSSLATYAEYELETQKPVFRQAHGFFGRLVPVEPLVVLVETDMLVRSPKEERIDIGATGMLQLDIEPLQGLHLIGTGEFWDPELGREPSLALGAWLSLSWFFLPHADVRLDLIQRSHPAGDARVSITSLLGQLHVFL